MGINIGNAPCSWGVEFAGDPRNPDWRTVLRDCAQAGYRGIELGPVGFMPEDPGLLGDALAGEGLTLIGGVVFRPFHDPAAWDVVVVPPVSSAVSNNGLAASRPIITRPVPNDTHVPNPNKVDGFASLDAFV